MTDERDQPEFVLFDEEFKNTLPGTYPARVKGCTCPIIDNHHGRGRYGNGRLYGWVISGDCPMHVQDKSP